jgi:hypothetical protein
MPDLRFAIPFALIVLGCATATPDGMSQESLAKHIEDIAGSATVSQNVVEFQYDGIRIACVSDAAHDRMRLISPIAELDSLQPAHLEVLLVANFHTTLDARYALSEGVIYAAFLHPLSTLTRAQLESAIRQVSALSRNFGSTYSSDELIYGAKPGQTM